MILNNTNKIYIFLIVSVMAICFSSCHKDCCKCSVEPCPECKDTCLLFTDFANPPEITKSFCAKFADHITEIPGHYFHKNCPLHDSETQYSPLLSRNKHDKTIYVIGIVGNNLIKIGGTAFSDNNISSLSLPNVTIIEEWAFSFNISMKCFRK